MKQRDKVSESRVGGHPTQRNSTGLRIETIAQVDAYADKSAVQLESQTDAMDENRDTATDTDGKLLRREDLSSSRRNGSSQAGKDGTQVHLSRADGANIRLSTLRTLLRRVLVLEQGMEASNGEGRIEPRRKARVGNLGGKGIICRHDAIRKRVAKSANKRTEVLVTPPANASASTAT